MNFVIYVLVIVSIFIIGICAAICWKLYKKKESMSNKITVYLYNNNLESRLFHPYDDRNLVQRLFGYCGCPIHKRHWFVYPKTLPMNTRYENERDNWVTCCEDFYKNEIVPRLEEMWDECHSF